MTWDWETVGELAVGIWIGISLGAWIAFAMFRSLAYEVLSHPSVRKLAGAADKLSGGGMAGWAGVAKTGLELFFGRQGPGGEER